MPHYYLQGGVQVITLDLIHGLGAHMPLHLTRHLSDTWLAFECDVQGSITLYDVVSTGKHTVHTFKTVVDTQDAHSFASTKGLQSQVQLSNLFSRNVPTPSALFALRTCATHSCKQWARAWFVIPQITMPLGKRF